MTEEKIMTQKGLIGFIIIRKTAKRKDKKYYETIGNIKFENSYVGCSGYIYVYPNEHQASIYANCLRQSNWKDIEIRKVKIMIIE